MARVEVYHLTPPHRLPLIEEEGMRTRAELSDRLGPPGPEDEAAPGTFGHGRRVSAYLRWGHAAAQRERHGAGVVVFTVDPAKAIGVPGSARDPDDPARYWSAARPLREWLAAEAPDDLEVHQSVAVRAKHLDIRAALLDEDDLDLYAPLVAEVADRDRISAKALMHLAIVASGAEADTAAFRAAVALAYRDEPDSDALYQELAETGPDRVASAALAEYGGAAPEAGRVLRGVLEETRAWADEQGLDHGRGLLMRSAAVLEAVTATP